MGSTFVCGSVPGSTLGELDGEEVGADCVPGPDGDADVGADEPSLAEEAADEADDDPDVTPAEAAFGPDDPPHPAAPKPTTAAATAAVLATAVAIGR
ncbi:MAG: hypothetical protein HOV87_25040 [Catenulispora sp.]|nr:hypothetical protein [Catenulispora sp.]